MWFTMSISCKLPKKHKQLNTLDSFKVFLNDFRNNLFCENSTFDYFINTIRPVGAIFVKYEIVTDIFKCYSIDTIRVTLSEEANDIVIMSCSHANSHVNHGISQWNPVTRKCVFWYNFFLTMDLQYITFLLFCVCSIRLNILKHY